MAENPQNPAAFKSQPWELFDTIAAASFLLGDTSDGLAIGAQVPAISANGEINFFQSSGRTRASMPWYTNIDVSGQLAYGLQVWQMYLAFLFPVMRPGQSVDPQGSGGGVPGPVRLMESILNFGVLSMNLGQEDQIEWPLARFGAGGGLAIMGGGIDGPIGANNSLPQAVNVLKLPEPIEMGRTQNLAAKIRLAPEVFALIGTDAAPGVGLPLLPYEYVTQPGEVPVVVQRALPPYAIRLGLVGRRVKNTQYGQLVR